jgi:DNA-binding response OmpR family regulator
MGHAMPARVLLIDDDTRLVEMLSTYLRARGARTRTALWASRSARTTTCPSRSTHGSC